MKPIPVLRLAAIVIVMTWLAIKVHELGHFTTYRLFGYHAHMSLQRVTPVGDVPASLDHWAKFAGPAVSIVAATILLLVARRRHGFVWVTASFTNASLRLFPCTIDLGRAIKSGPPFSDEGEVAMAFTTSPVGRSLLILVVIVVSLALTILAARQYRFQKHPIVPASTLLLVGISLLCPAAMFFGMRDSSRAPAIALIPHTERRTFKNLVKSKACGRLRKEQ